MTTPTYFTPRQIAGVCGVSQWLVTRHLRALNPARHPKSWYRFEVADFESVCRQILELKAECPKQPRHALRK